MEKKYWLMCFTVILDGEPQQQLKMLGPCTQDVASSEVEGMKNTDGIKEMLADDVQFHIALIPLDTTGAITETWGDDE